MERREPTSAALALAEGALHMSPRALAIAIDNLVAEAGGTVRVESEPGRGARFVVVMRRDVERTAQPQAAGAPRALSRGAG